MNVMALKISVIYKIQETARTISNITGGTQEQIQMIIDSGLLSDLIRVLEFDPFEARKEACWAITHLTSGGSIAQILKFVELGGVKPMCQMLTCEDGKIIQVRVVKMAYPGYAKIF